MSFQMSFQRDILERMKLFMRQNRLQNIILKKVDGLHPPKNQLKNILHKSQLRSLLMSPLKSPMKRKIIIIQEKMKVIAEQLQ